MRHHALVRDDQNVLTRARLAAIVCSSAGAIVGETLTGIISDLNPAAEHLYANTATEVVRQHISILAPPDLAHEATDLLARVHAGESVE